MRRCSIDEPLFSPRRLYNAVRLFFYFVIRDPAYTHGLLWYVRWYRRKEALFRRCGPYEELLRN